MDDLRMASIWRHALKAHLSEEVAAGHQAIRLGIGDESQADALVHHR